jgi:transcriptional regulator with XRE-family HTH domain
LPTAAVILKDARLAAGLTQRALASRANTAQSVVARIEAGLTSPGWDTLEGLLRAAGFSIAAQLQPSGADLGALLDEVPRILTLAPEDRLRELRNVDRFFSTVERL